MVWVSRSASLLEDAYQYLKWYLAGQVRSPFLSACLWLRPASHTCLVGGGFQEAAARARAEAEKEREAALPAGRKKGSSSSQGTTQEVRAGTAVR